MLSRRSRLAFAATSLMMASGAPARAAPDPLSAHHWKNRVLLVVAPDARDPKLRDQRAVFRAMGKAAHERDLVLVEAIGTTPEAAALRRRFALGPGFHALLIGKDGGAKLDADEPLRADALVPAIDAMPMRQDEMRRRS